LGLLRPTGQDYPGSTKEDCKKACLGQPTCAAFEWNPLGEDGKKCRVMFGKGAVTAHFKPGSTATCTTKDWTLLEQGIVDDNGTI